MPAKVSGVTSSQSAAAAQGAAGQRQVTTATAAPQAAGQAGVADSVAITDTASHLVTAEQGLAEVPVINAGRVAQIRGALQSGTYRVSSERIASRLLQYDRQLPAYPAD